MQQWIMVAGPVTAPTPEQKQRNIDALRNAALAVARLGHVPIFAHDLAEPLRALDDQPGKQERYRDLCIAVARRCDAMLLLDHSPGAVAEAAEFVFQAKPIYRRIEDIPKP
jgi:hypothetical protein